MGRCRLTIICAFYLRESGGFCEVARQKQLLMPGQNGDLIEAGLNETAESGGNSYGDCVS